MSDLTTIKDPPDQPAPNTTSVGGASPVDDAKTLHDETIAQTFTVALGERFGEYELLTEIARGGMGVVYRARQEALDRIVALKMILAGRLANADDVQRFRTEAEAAAKLRHPNIVAVHDVGAHDGQHYFTMEYIEGVSLDQRLGTGPLACKSAARYVRILAKAMQYAHQHGILHRDLKPSNILIDAADEPHITDFGLAKRLGGDSGQTRTGAVLGTPSYMSPEQAQGKTNELGPASDIYSLGAILYELITGRPPFRAETPIDTVLQVIEHQPVPPRLLNPKIDHDLETICLKCLEKDPEARYASAEDLGADLQRFLEGDSISARSVNVLERMARSLERDNRSADFSAWSSMLLAIAAVVLIEHVAVFSFIWSGMPRGFVTAVRGVQLASIGLLFWYNRRGRLMPTTAAERELWTIWIGYFTTYFSTIITTRVLTYRETVESETVSAAYFPELLPYPFIALVSGLAFFVMGANYWGRCYAIGALFFLVGPLMAIDLRFGPLMFGLLWSIILVVLGLHLRKQEVKLALEKPALTGAASQVPTVQFKEQK